MARVRETTMTKAPKWRRAADAIRDEIISGRLQPGDMLPTAVELALTYRISLSTLRAALLVLKAEGLIEGRQGDRVYVAPAPD